MLTRTGKSFLMAALFCLVIIPAAVMAAANVTNLEEKLPVIDSLMSHVHKAFNIPGIAVGIVANGRAVFQKGYGVRDHKDNESNVTPQTLFGIGSCTKSFTTFALDRMSSEFGAVSWNDLVMTYIPEFRLVDVSLRDRMKIKDLVTHVTGLPAHEFAAYHSNMTRQELLARVGHLQPALDLREGFKYNNIMFTIAGIVLERVTSEPWENAMRRLVFQHLNMTRTFASIRVLRELNDSAINNMASPHQIPADSDGSIVSIPWLDVTNVAPSGAIISCVEDMVKWIHKQLNLQPLAMEINMHNPQVVIPPGNFVNNLDGGETFAYGLGWMLSQYRDRRLVWHGGRIDGFITRVVLSPTDKVGVVILSNLDRTSSGHALHNVALRIIDTLTADPPVPQTSSDLEAWAMQQANTFFPPSAPSPSASVFSTNSSGPTEKEKRKVDQPEQYAGNFTNPGYGTLKVYVVESGLFVAHNNLRYALEPRRTKDFFKAKSTTLGFTFPCSFERDPFGDVSGIEIEFDSGPIPFTKAVSDDLFTVGYLRTFVGRFDNPQSSVQFQVNEKRPRSSLVANGTLPYSGKMTPRKPNWFQVDNALFEFVVKKDTVCEVRVHEEDLGTVLKKKC